LATSSDHGSLCASRVLFIKGIEGLLSKAGIGYASLVELGNIFKNYDDWHDRYRRFLKKAGNLLIGELYEVESPFCLL
jgi:hypothetical protein